MNNDSIKDAEKKLASINKTIAGLDPSIRAAAFEVLAPLYFEDYEPGHDGSATPKGRKHKPKPQQQEDCVQFLEEREHDKPKDNVHLIMAWLYSQYGVAVISIKEIRKCAAEASVTIPDRPDNLMRVAKHKGKIIYKQKDKGWRISVNGEAFVKETYDVKKGKKPRPSGDDE